MKATVLSRFSNCVIHLIQQDLKVIGDGRIALAASIVMMWLSNQRQNIPPREPLEDSLISQFFAIWYGYGSTMLMIWIMGLLMLISLATKRETLPYERAMLFIAVIFMMVSGVLTYQWGVRYDQSMF
ncbi:MAG: hypothetical protein J6N72_09445 [Psychrobacter sp.]|nr:hypothetical protein [Psychrobacter sp.]